MTKKYKKFLFVGAAILISVSVFLFRNKLVYLQSLGYFGIFLINLVGSATILLPVPALVSAFIGGAFLNPFLVAVFSAFGSTLGELTGYMAGIGGKEFIQDKRVKKIEGWMKKYGIWTIFALAAVPNPAFDLAGIIAGATKIPVYKYIIVVFFGKLAKFLSISYLGAGIIK